MALEAANIPAAPPPSGGLAAALERDILGTPDTPATLVDTPLVDAPLVDAPASPAQPTPPPAATPEPRQSRSKNRMAQALNDTLHPTETPVAPAAADSPVAPAAKDDDTAPPAAPLDTLKPDDVTPGAKLPIEDEPGPAPVEPPAPGDKAEYRIRELKGEIQTHKAAVAAAEQAKVQAETRATEAEALATRATELEAKIAQYEKEMSVVRLEGTEAYKRDVQAPLDKIMLASEAIAKRYDIDLPTLDRVLEMPDEDAARTALKELLSGLDVDDDDKYELRVMRTKLAPLIAKRSELYANADAALLELQAQTEKQSTAQVAARADERRAAIPTVIDKMARWLPELKAPLEGIAKETGDTDVDALPVDRRVYNHLAGRALAEVGKLYKAIKSERDELLDEVARYKSAAPNPGGFTPDGGAANAPKSLADAMLKSLGM